MKLRGALTFKTLLIITTTTTRSPQLTLIMQIIEKAYSSLRCITTYILYMT